MSNPKKTHTSKDVLGRTVLAGSICTMLGMLVGAGGYHLKTSDRILPEGFQTQEGDTETNIVEVMYIATDPERACLFDTNSGQVSARNDKWMCRVSDDGYSIFKKDRDMHSPKYGSWVRHKPHQRQRRDQNRGE